jgi:formiminotetrahydrofolate cyclodeaminase
MWAFSDEVASRSPAPAGVAAATMAADLGLSLLIKTLVITGKRVDLLELARAESVRLREAADQDIAAVRELMRSRNPEAMSKAIEIPMRAARSAAAGLDLCVEAAGEIQGLLSADLGAGTELLYGAIRAILVCVDANLHSQASANVAAERNAIEERAEQQAELVRALRASLP